MSNLKEAKYSGVTTVYCDVLIKSLRIPYLDFLPYQVT